MTITLRGKPYPKQIQFFKATQGRYIGYGGSRGGGKSWAARRKAVLMCLRYPGIQILLVRRRYKDLKENHLLQLKAEIGDITTYDQESHAFIFPNKARLRLGYCDSESDTLQYQGLAYDVIIMEEATQFTEFQFTIFTESNRSSGMMLQRFRPRMYFTCNPGGVGHAWFKRLFISRQYRGKEDPDNYIFIPSSVYENDYLMQNDPDYVMALEALPEARRKAMLLGDWDVFEGAFFTEWRNVPGGHLTRIGTHVIAPFERTEQNPHGIPDTWPRYRWFDFGYAKPFACLWAAVDPDGVLFIYRELYGCTGEPDVGVRWSPDRIARKIAEIEKVHEPRKVTVRGIADPAIWNKESGESIAEVMEKFGILFDKADNDRLNGWMQVHYRLDMGDDGRPRMYVTRDCPNTIRVMPIMLHDKIDVEDMDSKMEDHIPDAIRYGCMARPVSARLPRRAADPVSDPLNLLNDPTRLKDDTHVIRL